MFELITHRRHGFTFKLQGQFHFLFCVSNNAWTLISVNEVRVFTVINKLSRRSLTNAGLLHWTSNRSDWLAAAGFPGAVPVLGSCWGIRLFRKIPGRTKPHLPCCCLFFSPSWSVGLVCLLLRCSSTSLTPSQSKVSQWRLSSPQSNVALNWASSRAL